MQQWRWKPGTVRPARDVSVLRKCVLVAATGGPAAQDRPVRSTTRL